MGLDSYLYRTSFVSSHGNPKETDLHRRLLKIVGATKVAYEDGAVIVRVTVAYWRKANQIHQWFVDNCQGGVDDCRHADVSRAQLVTLRDLCKSLLAKKDGDQAEEALPPQSGFFFGSTEIDEYYWEDIEDTVKQLDRILDNTTENSRDWFEYHASW